MQVCSFSYVALVCSVERCDVFQYAAACPSLRANMDTCPTSMRHGSRGSCSVRSPSLLAAQVVRHVACGEGKYRYRLVQLISIYHEGVGLWRPKCQYILPACGPSGMSHYSLSCLATCFLQCTYILLSFELSGTVISLADHDGVFGCSESRPVPNSVCCSVNCQRRSLSPSSHHIHEDTVSPG